MISNRFPRIAQGGHLPKIFCRSRMHCSRCFLVSGGTLAAIAASIGVRIAEDLTLGILGKEGKDAGLPPATL
jgi:hypothetical protein